MFTSCLHEIPIDLDEALYRRIHLAVEFLVPDFALRQQIWQNHIPKAVQSEADVDLKEIAMTYELTGGFIKNVKKFVNFLIFRQFYQLYPLPSQEIPAIFD